jgi:hypothetical protein
MKAVHGRHCAWASIPAAGGAGPRRLPQHRRPWPQQHGSRIRGSRTCRRRQPSSRQQQWRTPRHSGQRPAHACPGDRLWQALDGLGPGCRRHCAAAAGKPRPFPVHLRGCETCRSPPPSRRCLRLGALSQRSARSPHASAPARAGRPKPSDLHARRSWRRIGAWPCLQRKWWRSPCSIGRTALWWGCQCRRDPS